MKKAHGFTLVLALTSLVTLLAAPAAANAGGPIGSRFVIHNDGSVDEWLPAVAYNSQREQYLVVWQAESPGPTKEVWGQRVSKRGAAAWFRLPHFAGQRRLCPGRGVQRHK